MSFKTKFTIIVLGIILLTALILGLKQKINSSDNIISSKQDDTSYFESFNDGLDAMLGELNDISENSNANVNAQIVSEKKQDKIKEKFKLEVYPDTSIEQDLFSLADKKLSAVLLSTTDSKRAVLDFYKQELGDQAKEVDTINNEAADKTETSLILFSDEGGEGELKIKVWRDQDKITHINIVISDNFKDPRVE